MDQNIRRILDDLYELDPSLRSDEAQLVKIVSLLLAARPNPNLDSNFVAELRSRLLSRKSVRKENNSWSPSSIINSLYMKRLNYVIGGFAICLLLVASAYYINNNQPDGKKVSLNNRIKITTTSANAFGKLDEVTQVNTQARGMGGGGNATDKAVSPEATSSTAIGFGGGMDKMIAPPYSYSTYRYIYKGNDLELSQTSLNVLKRLKGQEAAVDLGGLLNTLSFGLVNLNSFPGMRLQSASFIQNGGDGYNIYVSVDESNISISGAWPQQMYADKAAASSFRPCFEGDCNPSPPPITITDIPADDELITIANSFINDHGIPTQSYGVPEVQADWKVYYQSAPDKNNYYLPETVSVVYPLRIENQEVFDESGNKTGLNVSINVRNKKVVGVWDLSVQNYQASMYDAETDLERIMKFVERGGVYGYVDPNASKIIDVELGAPKMEYVRMWNYKDNVSEELLIPSLVFPVMEQPEGEMYFRKSVVVPLVKEILDRENGGPINILPLPGVETPAAKPE